MKVLALSDLHGHLNDYSSYQADICCIAGDIVPLDIQNSNKDSEEWFLNSFKPWAENLNVNKVFFIGGNHDRYLAQNNDFVHSIFQIHNMVTYLCHESYIYHHDNKEYVIFGTPYCHKFGNWYFMYDDETLKEKYNDIPNNTDILITHDCPYGYNDIILQKVDWANDEHIGNKPLANAILEKQPKIVFNAHLHTTSHYETLINESKCYNVSILDEYYKVTYLPTLIDYA